MSGRPIITLISREHQTPGNGVEILRGAAVVVGYGLQQDRSGRHHQTCACCCSGPTTATKRGRVFGVAAARTIETAGVRRLSLLISLRSIRITRGQPGATVALRRRSKAEAMRSPPQRRRTGSSG